MKGVIMANKVSTQLLITAAMRDRARTLAVVRDEVQAETLRELAYDAIPRFEAEVGERIEKLYNKLTAAGIDHSTGVKAILDAKIEYRKVMDMSDAQLRRVLKA
jgi:hypothetical protein